MIDGHGGVITAKNEAELDFNVMRAEFEFRILAK
jgi:hypothetical protein